MFLPLKFWFIKTRFMTSLQTMQPSTRLLFCRWRPVPEVLSFLSVRNLTAGTEEICRTLTKFPRCWVGRLTVKMFPGALTVLLALFSFTESKQKDFYSFKVVNSRGKLVSLEKYRGSVSLVLNSWVLQQYQWC